MRYGSLAVTLPDGETRRYRGSQAGPDAVVDLHDTKLLRRLATLGAIGLAGLGMKTLSARRGIEAQTSDVASFRL